jgi:hypothetical protein
MARRKPTTGDQTADFYLHMARSTVRAFKAASTPREKELWRLHARCWLALAERHIEHHDRSAFG